MKKIVVLYHNQCWDGFGGAWVAWKKFKNLADYIGVEHGAPVPKGLKNKEIYLIDFCYSKKEMIELRDNNLRVVVLDHHITKKAETEMMEEHLFSNIHSGSYLAWKYFFPSKKVPNLILYIQDNDLWKFKIKGSKEIMLSINLFPYSFDVWDKICNRLKSVKGKKEYFIQGKAISSYVQMLSKEISDSANKVILSGIKAWAVNAPRFIRSELGNLLATKTKGIDVGIVWYMENNGDIQVSLRSNGKVDVGLLAEKFDGGGHERASGFIFKSELKDKFPWKMIR